MWDYEPRTLEHKQRLEKNELLIADLKQQREDFAGLGTNKAKRFLNKAAQTDPIAKAVRLALEIEDKSITAKNTYNKYRTIIYEQKTTLIFELINLFKQHNWIYGVHSSDIESTSHIIFFEIPNCEQISWHFSPKIALPLYKGKWDGKLNSTLQKLEIVTKEIFNKTSI